MTDLHYASIHDLADQLRRCTVSPVELTQAMLARIEALDGECRAFITVMADSAMQQAAVAEREIAAGQWRGTLHGVPLAVKDLCWTANAPTSAGMRIHREFRPERNATVVDRLDAAGAVMLGKLSMTEGAYTNHHQDFPTPRNPWDARHWVGSSSSGSGVAAAAGLCFGTLGSDTGGSIRFPSACNNVTGLKPTWGRVSRFGVFTLADSLDHVGPMTRSVADCAAMLRAIAGEDANDPTCLKAPVPDYEQALLQGVSGLRVGIDEAYNSDDTDPEVAEAVRQAAGVLAARGARLRPVSFPRAHRAVAGWFPICASETALAHAATFPARTADYDPGLAGLIEQGRQVSGTDVARAWVDRLALCGEVDATFQDIDVLLVPTMPSTVPTLDELAAYGADDSLLLRLIRYTAPFDLTGHPTLTMPCGFSRNGLPLSFQLVGRRLDEATLCAAGHAFQQATDWHTRHPMA